MAGGETRIAARVSLSGLAVARLGSVPQALRFVRTNTFHYFIGDRHRPDSQLSYHWWSIHLKPASLSFDKETKKARQYAEDSCVRLGGKGQLNQRNKTHARLVIRRIIK